MTIKYAEKTVEIIVEISFVSKALSTFIASSWIFSFYKIHKKISIPSLLTLLPVTKAINRMVRIGFILIYNNF